MRKSTWVVLAAFAALLVGAVVLVTQKRERGITRLSVVVDKDAIDRVVISGKNAVELKKDGEAWRLSNGRLADATAVRRLTDALGKLESSDFVTDDGAKYAELEVDDEKGTTVVAHIGAKQVAKLVVGKTAGGASYVRVGDEVFKVRGVSPTVVSKTASAWTEKKLFTDKLDEVTRLEVKLAGAAPYVLVKKEGGWEMEDASLLPKGFRFDGDAARTLVSSLVNVRVKDFEDADPGADKTGLGDGADSLTFTVTPEVKKADEAEPATAPSAAAAAPVVRTLRLGLAKEGGKDVFGRVDGRAELFTLADSTTKNLRKAATDLRDMKLVKLDKDKVNKLTVFDGTHTHVFDKKGGVWTLTRSSEPLPPGFELDPSMIDRRVAAVANAKGTKLASGSLGVTSAKVTVGLEGGGSVSLTFGKETRDEDKEVFYAQGNADGEVYLVGKWVRSSLAGGIATFKRQVEQPQIDPQALSGLPPEVREQLMRQMQSQGREREMMQRLQGKLPKPPAPSNP